MGYTVIRGEKNGIEAEVTFFVPNNFNGEVQKVVLKNTGETEKKL